MVTSCIISNISPQLQASLTDQLLNNLSLWTPAPLSYVRAIWHRMENVCKGILIFYNQPWKQMIFLIKATCIPNCDETNFPLCPISDKLLAKKGQKILSLLKVIQKNQITLLSCTIGQCCRLRISPVCFNQKTLNVKLTEGEVPGTVYGLHQRGG